MTQESHRLRKEDIQPLVQGHGACFVSHRIRLDGKRVGWFYRDEAGDAADSGWWFLSGDEPPGYVDDSRNWSILDVNTLVNYDRDVLPWLHHPPGSECVRKGDSAEFELVVKPPGSEQAPWARPDLHGEAELCEAWSGSFPERFRCREERTGELVCWRPGLTCFLLAYDTGLSLAEGLAMLRSNTPDAAFDVLHERSGDLERYGYRIVEPAGDRRRPALQAFTLQHGGMLALAAYFDEERELAVALGLWRGFTPRRS